MKAFWWFKDNSIAGMARPGFNRVQWFDLPFDEAVLLGWLGKFSDGTHDLNEFRSHIKTYSPRIYKFYDLNNETGSRALEILNSAEGIYKVLQRLADRTKIFNDYSVDDSGIHIKVSAVRIMEEIEQIKKNGVKRIVTLTENHNEKDTLGEHFKLYHISLQDLNAPRIDQVKQMVPIIEEALRSNEILAVHCLAGIGRTSTMLVGAHILMGEDPVYLENELKRRNPSFVMSGPQGDFLRLLRK